MKTLRVTDNCMEKGLLIETFSADKKKHWCICFNISESLRHMRSEKTFYKEVKFKVSKVFVTKITAEIPFFEHMARA